MSQKMYAVRAICTTTNLDDEKAHEMRAVFGGFRSQLAASTTPLGAKNGQIRLENPFMPTWSCPTVYV